jgi:hypothetical protein
MKTVSLQATIGGISANASDAGETVYGIFEVGTGVLLIDGASTVRSGEIEVRRPRHAVVTNNPAADDRDELFQDESIRQAIEDYFAMSGRGLLEIDPKVARVNPSTKIEPDGMDDHGRKFRVAPDISNGQMAVLVMCWFALRQTAIAGQLAAFDDMGIDTDIVTVGMGSHAGIPLGPDGWPI